MSRPLGDLGRQRRLLSWFWPARPGAYQAWVPPQCGHPTEVDTCASNTYPQLQLYSAWSSGAPTSRRRLLDVLVLVLETGA